MVSVVSAIAKHETEVVAALSQSGRDTQVFADPVIARFVPMQVTHNRVEEDPQRLLFGLQNQLRVVIAALQLREAPHETQHASETIWTHPADGERAAAAATPSTYRPLARVIGDGVAALNRRNDLGQEKSRVCITEGVIFDIPAAGLARGDEYSDGYRHLAVVDQIVEDDRSPHLTVQVEVPPGILEDH